MNIVIKIIFLIVRILFTAGGSPGNELIFQKLKNVHEFWFVDSDIERISSSIPFQRKIEVPLVIRLAGTNVEKGNKILRESKIKYIEANSLEDAANKAVKVLKK